jgi:cytoskeletal protein CcmA (bactofilin family)
MTIRVCLLKQAVYNINRYDKGDGMKRLKLLLAGLLVTLPILGWAATTRAQNFQTGDVVSVQSDKTIDSTLYTAGRDVTIAGTINGDVFCGGQNVTVSGTINGDLICAAQTMTISGRVNGDIRVAAQTLSLNSEVTGRATVIAQTFNSDSKARIGGDLTLLGQSASLSAHVGRDIAGTIENLTINGHVGRNISAEIGHLSLANTAQVDGGIYYTSQNDLDRQDGAVVAGEVHRTEPTKAQNEERGTGNFVWWYMLSMLALALSLILLVPQAFQRSSVLACSSLGMTFLVGFVASILAPIVVIMLCVTVIGIPLGLLALVVWITIIGLSGPFAAYLIGRLVWREGRNAILVMGIGSIILILLMLVPILNFVVFLAVMWFGVGTVLRAAWRSLGGHGYDVEPITVSETATPGAPEIPAKKGKQ